MNKTLKFDTHLVPQVLSGAKTATWRLFDDKDLQPGDMVDFLDRHTKEKFATAELISVTEKMFSEMTEDDWVGHEKYPTPEAMYLYYTMAYNKPVTGGTLLKIIKFKLI